MVTTGEKKAIEIARENVSTNLNRNLKTVAQVEK